MLGKTDLVLVEYHGNYADEFDVDATATMAYGDYLDLIELMKRCLKEQPQIEVYFGTNEYIIIDTNDFDNNLSYKYITNGEHEVLEKLNLQLTGFYQILDHTTYAERLEEDDF